MNNSRLLPLILLLSIKNLFAVHQGPDIWFDLPAFGEFYRSLGKTYPIAKELIPLVTIVDSVKPSSVSDGEKWSCWFESALANLMFDFNQVVKSNKSLKVGDLYCAIFGYRDKKTKEFVPGLFSKSTRTLFEPWPIGQFFDHFDLSFWNCLREKVQRSLIMHQLFDPELTMLYLAACYARQSTKAKEKEILRIKEGNKFLRKMFTSFDKVSLFGLPQSFIFGDESNICPNFCFLSPYLKELNVFQQRRPEKFSFVFSTLLLGYSHAISAQVSLDWEMGELKIFLFDSSGVSCKKLLNQSDTEMEQTLGIVFLSLRAALEVIQSALDQQKKPTGLSTEIVNQYILAQLYQIKTGFFPLLQLKNGRIGVCAGF